MNRLLNGLVLEQIELRFFDVEICIRSDSNRYIDLFAQMYQRFVITRPLPDPTRQLDVVVLTSPKNHWREPVLILGSQVWRLRNNSLLEGYVYEKILFEITAHIHTHFLLHAGVVEKDGQGIIIAGGSGHGKTTLVLALLQHGFKFLSDEMAAIGRSDRHIHPFPRSLRLRPDTLGLLGDNEAARGIPMWMDKLLCDIEHILPGCVGQPAVLSHILILQDPAKTPSIKPNDGPQTVSIVFDRMDACFMTQLAATDSLDYLDCDLYKGYPIARFTGSSSAAIVSAVEELCYQHQVLMLDVIKRHEGRPDFSMPARMEPIPKSEAIIELLRHFQGGHKSVLLQEQTDASSVHLFMELAALIEDAQCHRLFVGPLEQMIDLVSRLPTASKDWRSK